MPEEKKHVPYTGITDLNIDDMLAQIRRVADANELDYSTAAQLVELTALGRIVQKLGSIEASIDYIN